MRTESTQSLNFSTGENERTLTIVVFDQSHEWFRLHALVNPGKALPVAISLVIIIILDSNQWIVSVSINLGQFSEFTKGQLALIGRCWNSTQKPQKPNSPGKEKESEKGNLWQSWQLTLQKEAQFFCKWPKCLFTYRCCTFSFNMHWKRKWVIFNASNKIYLENSRYCWVE